MIPFYDRDKIELQDEFKVLLLNPSNRILGMYPMSMGGITGREVDMRMIFIATLRAKAMSIIAAHNHPSGKLCPSEPDKVITRKMAAAGGFLEIEVLDHGFFQKTSISHLPTKDYYDGRLSQLPMNMHARRPPAAKEEISFVLTACCLT